MKVRAKEDCFIAGVRRKKGAEFEFDGEEATGPIEAINGETVAPAASTAPAASSLSNKEMKALLDAAGVEYAGNASNQVLADLLKEVQANVAPAASSAPDKSTQI